MKLKRTTQLRKGFKKNVNKNNKYKFNITIKWNKILKNKIEK
jgi:hypothetical protein